MEVELQQHAQLRLVSTADGYVTACTAANSTFTGVDMTMTRIIHLKTTVLYFDFVYIYLYIHIYIYLLRPTLLVGYLVRRRNSVLSVLTPADDGFTLSRSIPNKENRLDSMVIHGTPPIPTAWTKTPTVSKVDLHMYHPFQETNTLSTLRVVQFWGYPMEIGSYFRFL